MWSKPWKRAAGAGLVAIAVASCGTKGGEGPVFATAEPVAAEKPDAFGFKQAIRVKTLEGLTETVKRNFSTVLHAEDFARSLRQSLANDEMLAPESGRAAYELTPYFVDLRTAPVTDEVTAAQAIFQYRVVRIEDNTLIFNKRIKSDFSSMADPEYDDAGFFGRTLRMVGLAKESARPDPAIGMGRDETKGPGPERETAREIHAMRSAIALNMRKAMRHLIVASPERIVAPQTADETATPEEAGPETGIEAEAAEAEETAAETDDGSLPPIAPAQNAAGHDSRSE